MTNANKQRITVLVTGHVQGVGYRFFTQRCAQDQGLTGYAENLTDGRVEVVAEGDEAALERLLLKLKQGPPHAQVETLEVERSEATGLNGFHTY